MPVTPFHFGPGLALKAVSPTHCSFLVFAATQVMIDCEPLYYMSRGGWPIHRFFHTYIGATLVAIIAYVVFRPVCGICISIRENQYAINAQVLRLGIKRVSHIAALSGAFIGAYSHIALDSIMHEDVLPFAPFSNTNVMLDYISIVELHLYCFMLGAAGAVGVGFWWFAWKEEKR